LASFHHVAGASIITQMSLPCSVISHFGSPLNKNATISGSYYRWSSLNLNPKDLVDDVAYFYAERGR